VIILIISWDAYLFNVTLFRHHVRRCQVETWINFEIVRTLLGAHVSAFFLLDFHIANIITPERLLLEKKKKKKKTMVCVR